MTTTADGEIYQLIVKHTLFNQQIINVHWFKAYGTVEIEETLIESWRVTLTNFLYPNLSGNIGLSSITARRVIPQQALDIVYTPPTPTHPGSFLAALPPQVAVVINLRSVRPGRKGYGRWYIAGLWEGGQLNGQLQADRLTGFNQWCTRIKELFIDPPDVNRFELGVFSRVLGGNTFPYNAAGFAKCYAISTQPILGTMRSRRVGVGS